MHGHFIKHIFIVFLSNVKLSKTEANQKAIKSETMFPLTETLRPLKYNWKIRIHVFKFEIKKNLKRLFIEFFRRNTTNEPK